ncbi:hypothetical protein MLD52_14110 [Puniceicoccaceae bacterium K14]|nr:hypothetical protein [Puniceicoccaceae bacterium K14]
MESKTFSLKRIVSNPLLPWVLILAIWIAWILIPFFDVGMATQDQLGFSLEDPSNIFKEVYSHARKQGRIYFNFTKIVDVFFAVFPDHDLAKVVGFSLFALAPLCFSYAVFRSNIARFVFIWFFFCFIWLGTSHLPPAAYPAVNHLPFIFWIPIALLIRKSTKRTEPPNMAKLLILGILSFICFFQYEPVALMSAVLIPWIIYTTELSVKAKQRFYFATGTAVFVYALCYLTWSLKHPSSYSGLEIGNTTFFSIIKAFIAYSIGSLPWLGTFNTTQSFTWGDKIYGDQLLKYQINSIPSIGILELTISVLGIVAIIAIVCSKNRARKFDWEKTIGTPFWKLLLLSLITLGAINGPISLSKKYQLWADKWSESYLTSHLALFPLCAIFACLALYFGKLVRVKKQPIGLLICLLISGVSAIFVHDHNKQYSVYLRENLARWDAVSMISSSSHLWGNVRVNAPQLYFEIQSNEKDWSKYWNEYTEKRYSKSIDFSAYLDPSEQPDNEYVNTKIYHQGNGSIRCIMVQTTEALFIISTKSNRPTLLVDRNYNGIKLNLSSFNKIEGSPYFASKVKNNSLFVGLDKTVSPVWSFPSY